MEKTKTTLDTRKLVLCAILTALVVVLQLVGSFIHFGPFSVTVVLVPIVLGAAMCGMWAGAWLGFVFGFVVLFTDSAAFMAINPAGTVITVLAKGILAGLIAAIVYRWASKINSTVGVIASALVCPVINTAVFVLGCNLFFMDTIASWGAAAGFESAGAYIIYGMIGGNFLFEVLFNIVLCPVILRLLNYRKA